MSREPGSCKKVPFYMAEERFYNIVFVGEPGVGKTALLIRIKEGIYDDAQQPTIGVQMLKYDYEQEGQEPTKFRFWDTAGSERAASYIPQQIKAACGIVLTFAVSEKVTFDKLKEWVETVKKSMKEDCLLVLCGNKCDSESAVTKEEINEFCEAHGAKYVAVSAKTGDGVDALLKLLTSATPIVNSRVVPVEETKSQCKC